VLRWTKKVNKFHLCICRPICQSNTGLNCCAALCLPGKV